MATLGVGAADPRNALETGAAGIESLTDLLDTLKAVHAIGGRALRFVLLAEFGEVAFGYGMELAATTGNVPARRHGGDRDCRAHTIV